MTAPTESHRRPAPAPDVDRTARSCERILFYVNSLARGGAETQLVQVALQLRGAGHEVGIVTLLPDNDFGAELAGAGLSVEQLGLTGLASGPAVLARAVRLSRRRRPDVTVSFLFQATMLMRLVNLVGRPRRSISSMRNEMLETRTRSLLYFVTSFLDDAVVANSETARHRLVASRTVPASRAAVIYNGVDVSRFRSDTAAKRSAVRRELGLSDDDFVFLGVGRLTRQKRWDLLVRALSDDAGPRSATCLLAGDGPLRPDLERQAADAGLSDRICFLGLRHDVDALMSAADCLVLCSSYEGTPNVVLEALAAGLHIVATDVGACAELLEGTDGMLVPAGDPAALAAAMARSVALGGRTQRSTPTRDALSRFSWGRISQDWATIVSGDVPSSLGRDS